MILSWMVVAYVVVAAAGAAALALEGAARALGRPTRLPWVAALAFSTIWPAWLLLCGMAHQRPDAAGMGATVLPAILVGAGHDAMSAVARRLPAADARVSLVLLSAWALVTVTLLARLLLGIRSLHRQRKGWIARELDGVPVLVAPDTGPAVVGVIRPAIVLPEWVLALDPGLLRLVLRHELEHVRARDTVPRLIGALVTALVPWNFLLRWQADRLALAIEVDCDARVLRADVRRERYGLLLLAIAQRQSTAVLAPALSEPTSHLERRITAMQRSTPRRPVLVGAALTATAVVALVVACSAPAPNEPGMPGRHSDARASVVREMAVWKTVPLETVDSSARAYSRFQVDKRVLTREDNPAPSYPAILESSHVEGEVLAQFVVDTSGRAEMNTFKVLKQSNELFTRSVASVLPQMRFYAAEVNGRKVRQLVQMPFIFKVPK